MINEDFRSNTFEQTDAPSAEENVLFRIHSCTEGTRSCGPSDATELHNDFQRCEAYSLYEAYTQNRVPTLERMSQVMDGIISRVPEELRADAESQKILKLMKGRTLVISGSVRSYAESVIRYVKLKNSGANIRDPEMFVKADHDRRRRHNNLLQALRDLPTLLTKAEDLGLCSKSDFEVWQPGDSRVMTRERLPLFATSAIDNRDLIKNWALAADFAEQYSKLTTLLKNRKNEERPVH